MGQVAGKTEPVSALGWLVSRSPQVQAGVSGRQKVHAGVWEAPECGVPVG